MSDVGSLSASYSSYSGASASTQASAQQLSSGQRISSAAGDAAGMAIGSRMSAQLSGMDMAARNSMDGVSMVQTASGALDTLTSNMSRMRELAVQAGNGTLNDSDRAAIQSEINQLNEQNSSLLEDANYNGQALFQNSQPMQLQTGPNAGDTTELATGDLLQTLKDSGVFSLDVSSSDAASMSLSTLDLALSQVGERQSGLGALSNRLDSNLDNLAERRLNTAAAQSRIMDTDIAKAASEWSSSQIKDQMQLAMQAQANAHAGDMLQLLG
ncbi:flagellin [Parathalassolituus penaei]|uniref:Flagellin n=1 Tax=Parathalassolituus penaei TaxID=2997323 RepID=A0A9X3ISW4_9GAMM|nr:flagellin [Parathalassolituus penaei]MCY0964583.1 flagellin [Parathalassolituus penaei]